MIKEIEWKCLVCDKVVLITKGTIKVKASFMNPICVKCFNKTITKRIEDDVDFLRGRCGGAL